MTELTSGQMAKAVLLKTEFAYYAPRCLKIKDKDGKIVPFVFNRAQQYLHQKIEEQKERIGKIRALVIKGRQQGISTYVEGRFYWRTSMGRGKRAYILTHEDKATANLFGMTKRYHDNCPDVLKPHTKNHSEVALTFDVLDSEFSVATAGSKETGRSGTGQLFHGSEVAFWPNDVSHMAGLGQTIPNEDANGNTIDTEIFLESTGNGMGNMFYHMVQDALRGESEYIVIFIPWFWQAEYKAIPPATWVPDPDNIAYMELYEITKEQAYWRERKTKTDFKKDYKWFDQEYPATIELAFRRQAQESLFSLELVEKAMRNKDIEAIGPKIMGIDPAESPQGDDTVFVLRQGRVVSKMKRFHGKNTMEIVGLAGLAIAEWEPDFINVDAGGLGSGVADRLIELGHPVQRVLFGERAYDDELYSIRKDEMAGEAKEWLENQPNQIINDDALKSDMVTPGFSHDSSLRLKVETKEHIKNVRHLPSPDGFDAFCLTFATKVSTYKKKPNRTLETPNWRTM